MSDARFCHLEAYLYSPTDRNRFYTTAQFSKLVESHRDETRQPASLVHAKEAGTHLTLCGIRCESWVRFWGQPFSALIANRCSECARRVAELSGGWGTASR